MVNAARSASASGTLGPKTAKEGEKSYVTPRRKIDGVLAAAHQQVDRGDLGEAEGP
jgi:hypothetical protein